MAISNVMLEGDSNLKHISTRRREGLNPKILEGAPLIIYFLIQDLDTNLDPFKLSKV